MDLASEIKMFGETVSEMEAARPKFYSRFMYAMAILSDAQETLPLNPEQARQFINKAKYFISTGVDSQSAPAPQDEVALGTVAKKD